MEEIRNDLEAMNAMENQDMLRDTGSAVALPFETEAPLPDGSFASGATDGFAPAPASRRIRVPASGRPSSRGFPLAVVTLAGSLLAEAVSNVAQLVLYVFRRRRIKSRCRDVICAPRAGGESRNDVEDLASGAARGVVVLLVIASLAVGVAGCSSFDEAIDETIWSTSHMIGPEWDFEGLWWSVDNVFGITSAGDDAQSLIWTIRSFGDLK